MKLLLTLTREQSLQILIDVPGIETIEDARKLQSWKYRKQLADIADTLDDCEWDETGWEETVKVVGIERDQFDDMPDGTVHL